MDKHTAAITRHGGREPSRIKYPEPNGQAVAAWRSCFRTFISPPNSFAPYDVIGVLFWSRLLFCGDFMPQGVAQTPAVRARALVRAIRFWLRNLEPEMSQAGLAVRLSYSEDIRLEHASHRLDRFLLAVLFPAMDGVVTPECPPERARGVIGMWRWARDQAVKAGKISREDMLGAARAALCSGGVAPGSTEAETIAILQELRKTWSPGAITFFTDKRTGRARLGARQLRDSTPLLRRGRRMQARERKCEKRAVSLDRPVGQGDTALKDLVPSTAQMPDDELLSLLRTRHDVSAVETFKRVCEQRKQRRLARRDARARALAREHLAQLALGEVTGAEVLAGTGTDKGNFSKAYRSELGWALKETRRRLAGE